MPIDIFNHEAIKADATVARPNRHDVRPRRSKRALQTGSWSKARLRSCASGSLRQFIGQLPLPSNAGLHSKGLWRVRITSRRISMTTSRSPYWPKSGVSAPTFLAARRGNRWGSRPQRYVIERRVERKKPAAPDPPAPRADCPRARVRRPRSSIPDLPPRDGRYPRSVPYRAEPISVIAQRSPAVERIELYERLTRTSQTRAQAPNSDRSRSLAMRAGRRKYVRSASRRSTGSAVCGSAGFLSVS